LTAVSKDTSFRVAVGAAGEANALFTEDVPPSDAPIFAATATHCILLPAGKEPTPELLGAGAGAGQEGKQVVGSESQPQEQQGAGRAQQQQEEGVQSTQEARLVFEVCGYGLPTLSVVGRT
jgi:hypothetical protein